jgi:hypothetical protein
MRRISLWWPVAAALVPTPALAHTQAGAVNFQDSYAPWLLLGLAFLAHLAWSRHLQRSRPGR